MYLINYNFFPNDINLKINDFTFETSPDPSGRVPWAWVAIWTNWLHAIEDQPKVINGYSDLMVEIFGEKWKHARSAVGMYALPFHMAVEVEVIVEVED